jgi:hypothetical protein
MAAPCRARCIALRLQRLPSGAPETETDDEATAATRVLGVAAWELGIIAVGVIAVVAAVFILGILLRMDTSTTARAEVELQRLAKRLDEPFVSKGDPDDVCMAIGRHARALHRGYLHCIGGAEHVASRTLLRPAVEANVLLRFLRESPEHRTRLWHAETFRTVVDLIDDLDKGLIPEELTRLVARPSDAEILELRKAVGEARKAAADAGVSGVSKRGYLIAPLREQVEILNTPEAWQAYITAYGPLSSEVHVGHFAFQDSVREELADGTVVLRDEAPTRHAGERALASAVFASTLVIVSDWLDLGITEAAEAIRVELVGA